MTVVGEVGMSQSTVQGPTSPVQPSLQLGWGCIDGVLLCNYFPDHAKCAIRAMERGIAVFSECTSAPTLAECVALVETAERTGAKYMIAENYPFSAAMLEMKRLVDGGSLGI